VSSGGARNLKKRIIPGARSSTAMEEATDGSPPGSPSLLDNDDNISRSEEPPTSPVISRNPGSSIGTILTPVVQLSSDTLPGPPTEVSVMPPLTSRSSPDLYAQDHQSDSSDDEEDNVRIVPIEEIERTNAVNDATVDEHVEYVQAVDTSAADFVESSVAAVIDEKGKVKDTDAGAKVKKKKGKKRKATESIEDDDEGSCCTICFEKWTNSGEHRIASMKCGHFFGFNCIEKWLRTSSSCPNCNEKSSKKDLRVHYVAKLTAIDTGEKDRALADLEKTKIELRELQLRYTELQVRLKLQQEKMSRLEAAGRLRDREGRARVEQDLGTGFMPPSSQGVQQASQMSGAASDIRLVYVRRHEVCRPSPERERACRVLAYSQYNGMLVISQPGANPLFPGFGVRRFSLLDQRLGDFVHLSKEVIRDLAFHPSQQELLLSCGQGREARITNMSSCQEVTKFSDLDSEAWACDWGRGPGAEHRVFLGLKRGQVCVLDTRAPTTPPNLLSFPGTERRPIIGLRSLPPCAEAGFPFPGILVMTLGSVWFWEFPPSGPCLQHRLSLATSQAAPRLFWSLSVEQDSRLGMVITKPSPVNTTIVFQLAANQVSGARVVTANILMTSPGSSYSLRSFLRGAILPLDREGGRQVVVTGRGTSSSDHKLTVREVGSERILQEISIGKPVLDVQALELNGVKNLAVLGENELTMYKWEQ